MCDTFIYRQGTSAGSRIWFGKNSDREPNEAHEVIFWKGKTFPDGSTVKCTYLEIPEAARTFDVILCKPVWMWGAEMGANNRGVVIGNEAVFTRGGASREPALTGMDLLRLALERSETALSAVRCITGLLEEFGQGGNCGFCHPFYYNNAFLIADRTETWVLETVGRDWVARRFDTSTAISNGLTLKADWDMASAGFAGVKNLAAEKSDPLVTSFSQAGKRRECVLDGLTNMPQPAGIQDAFNILRSHGTSHALPEDSLLSNTVCMHAGFGPVRIDQTTGSMVVDLSGSQPVIWITGTSLPCLSLFHPVYFSNFDEDMVISSEQDWRDHEIFARNAIFCPEPFVSEFRLHRDELEHRLIQSAGEESGQPGLEKCLNESKELYRNWTEKAVLQPKVRGHLLMRSAWRTFNREAGISVDL